MDKTEFYRLIDCCRTGNRDLAEPEMAALRAAIQEDPELRAVWEASQTWNTNLRAALQDVAVPAGLSERILANLQPTDDGRGKTAEPSGVAEPIQRKTPSAAARYRSQSAVLGIVAAAALVAWIVWIGPWRQPLDAARVAEMARSWVEHLDAKAWRDESPPIEQYPLDPSLRFRMVGWQPFTALGDARAVAYLAEVPPDRAAAYLLVIRTGRGRQLPKFPPPNPDSTTEGICLGVWKNAGRLYVLVVPGSQQRYQRLFSSQSFVQRLRETPDVS